MIDYKNLTKMINDRIQKILNNNQDIFKNINCVIVSQERIFQQNDEENDDDIIYCAINFLEANVYLGQSNLPATLNFFSQKNIVYETQQLINLFVNENHLQFLDKDKTILQAYTLPSATSIFNEVHSGYKIIFSISAGFLISPAKNFIEVFYHTQNGELKKVNAITFSFNGTSAVDPQATFGTSNLSKSTARVRTFSMNLITYFTDNELNNKILDIYANPSNEEINNSFMFDLICKNGKEYKDLEFKCVSMELQQQDLELQIPAFAITFTS